MHKSNERLIGARCFPNGKGCFNNGEKVNGLCYDGCDPGYSGGGENFGAGATAGAVGGALVAGPAGAVVGAVVGFFTDAMYCYTDCSYEGMIQCGAAACSTNANECAKTTTTQVLSVLVVAANIATLGMSSGSGVSTIASGTSKSVTVGQKVYRSVSPVGKTLINLLQKVKPAKTSAYKALKIQKVFNARNSQLIINNAQYIADARRLVQTGVLVTYNAASMYRESYAANFAEMTSPEIDVSIDSQFDPKTALFFKKAWADVTADEMAEAEGWATAKLVLSVVSLEPTGLVGLAEAYANPICNKHVPFPCIEAADCD